MTMAFANLFKLPDFLFFVSYFSNSCIAFIIICKSTPPPFHCTPIHTIVDERLGIFESYY